MNHSSAPAFSEDNSTESTESTESTLVFTMEETRGFMIPSVREAEVSPQPSAYLPSATGTNGLRRLGRDCQLSVLCTQHTHMYGSTEVLSMSMSALSAPRVLPAASRAAEGRRRMREAARLAEPSYIPSSATAKPLSFQGFITGWRTISKPAGCFSRMSETATQCFTAASVSRYKRCLFVSDINQALFTFQMAATVWSFPHVRVRPFWHAGREKRLCKHCTKVCGPIRPRLRPTTPARQGYYY